MTKSHQNIDVLKQIQSQRPSIISTKLVKFSLGSVVATPKALALLARTGFTAAQLIERHISGDWGACCIQDAAMNEDALMNGARIFSVYRLVEAKLLSELPRSQHHKLPTVWVITNAKNDAGVRDYTTVLLPECY